MKSLAELRRWSQNKFAEMKVAGRKCLKTVRPYLKPFAVLCGILLIACFALLRANYDFNDDNARIGSGRQGWDNYSRYVSMFLSTLLHTSTTMTDISPLTQLIALALMAAAGIILIRVVSGRKKISFWQLLAVLPLCISPYFMECLSYKFDAPYMALSVLAAVMPLLWRKAVPWKFNLAALLSALVICMSYQAAIGIMPMLLIFVLLRDWSRGKSWAELWRPALRALLCYAGGVLIFKFVILTPFNVNKSGYVSSGVVPVAQLLPTILERYAEYARLIVTDVPLLWIVLLAGVFVAFVYAFCRRSRRKVGQTLLLVLLASVVAFMLAFGVYPVLETEFIAPRAMYGFGAMVAMMAIYVASCRKLRWPRLVVAALAWCLVVYASVYGNALMKQDAYARFREQILLADLNRVSIASAGPARLERDARGDYKVIYAPITKENQLIYTIWGGELKAPETHVAREHYPVLDRTIRSNFQGGKWSFAHWDIQKNYGAQMLLGYDHHDFSAEGFELVLDSQYHTIYASADKVQIYVILK